MIFKCERCGSADGPDVHGLHCKECGVLIPAKELPACLNCGDELWGHMSLNGVCASCIGDLDDVPQGDD